VYVYTDFDTATQMASYTGLDSGWTLENLDLSAFAGDPEIKVAFMLSSDGGVTYQGYWVDYVGVLVAPEITSCDPPSGRVNVGSTFKLLGSGFGRPDAGSGITVPNASGDVNIASGDCSLWTDGEIDFTVPDGSKLGTITLAEHSLSSSWDSFTPVLPPPDINNLQQY